MGVLWDRVSTNLSGRAVDTMDPLPDDELLQADETEVDDAG